MDNMTKWNQMNCPPQNVLKSITGGRLQGMTDIKPQWRYKILTEIYGPCGEGWGFEIKRLWRELGTEGQIFVFAQILLWAGESHDIPGVGGSMLIAQEKKGLFNCDEAYKMAVTDALSSASKMLGVGAEVYMGNWDGTKYKKPPQKHSVEIYQQKIAVLKHPAEFDVLVAGLKHVADDAAVRRIKLNIKHQGAKLGIIWDKDTKKFVKKQPDKQPDKQPEQPKELNEPKVMPFLLEELKKIKTKDGLIKFEQTFDPQISKLTMIDKSVYSAASADQMALITNNQNGKLTIGV